MRYDFIKFPANTLHANAGMSGRDLINPARHAPPKARLPRQGGRAEGGRGEARYRGRKPAVDFIAIGDTTIDAFIRLKEASVHCTINRERCEICMRFADKIPYEEVYEIPAVGNSANAAVAAARLGLKSALVANVGGDYYGKLCFKAFKDEKVGTKFIRVHKNVKTNYHYVLWYEDDRTILIKHQKYEYTLPNIGDPKWVYLSSLGGDADNLYPALQTYFEAHPQVRLAFQPGTYQIKLGNKLDYFYKRSEVFFCNKDEAERILGLKEDTDIKVLLGGMKALGPKIVVITDGPAGAYVQFDSEMWKMPVYPDPKPPYERTGAGDAFSSTFTVALALGLSPQDALRWAPVNSMSVVQYVGAREGLLTRENLEEYLKQAPADYQPQRI